MEYKNRIYVVRHGQSTGNVTGTIQGHADAALTELGHQQADITANYINNNLQKFDIKRIYASDLQRAYNTAGYVGNILNLEVSKLEALREAYFGKWEGMNLEEIKANGEGSLLEKWRVEKTWRPEWCESFEQLSKRSTNIISKIALEAENNALVASHGGFIYSLITTLDQDKAVTIDNCSISTLEFTIDKKYNEVLNIDVLEVNKIVY